MEIARSNKVFWLQIPDKQSFAARSVLLHLDRSRFHPAFSFKTEPQSVPMLDWPQSLFEDASPCN